MFGSLKQRSSWLSSFVTGLIGWNGFVVMSALAFGYSVTVSKLFLIASAAAIIQVLILRFLFFPLRLNSSKLAGFVWGAISAAAIIIVEMRLFPFLREHSIVWFVTAIYVGPAVGLFLSYFYQDDRRIENEARANDKPVDYGRDAHWLEPFLFGAIAYLIIFLPVSFDVAISALMVGAMSGVVAAGVSHFFLFAQWRQSVIPLLLSIIAGLVQGAITGLLLRRYTEQLFLQPMIAGAIAGVLTYLSTSLRGKNLARRELEIVK